MTGPPPYRLPSPMPSSFSDDGGPVSELVRFFRHGKVAVLTGAGCSTESGIPDYRGPTTGRMPRQPIQHAAFLRNALVRRRYWARSFWGWPKFAAARPNAAHAALATLERRGWLSGLITQNVDGLHHQAGSHRVVELHGALSRVVCLSCQSEMARSDLQVELAALNADLAGEAELAPDGDAEVSASWLERFQSPVCGCGGDLMPAVVFFGGHVPPSVLSEAWGVLEQAEALLVVGSSLAVFSGYRFVKRAAEQGKPVAILNRGETRGDALAALRIEGSAGPVLSALARRLDRA